MKQILFPKNKVEILLKQFFLHLYDSTLIENDIIEKQPNSINISSKSNKNSQYLKFYADVRANVQSISYSH